MNEFLNNLDLLDKVFLTCALIGGVLFTLWTLLQVFLGGHGGGDVHADIGGVDFHTGDVHTGDVHGGDIQTEGSADAALSFRALSLQGMMAFVLMFGLVGLATHNEMHLPVSLSLACAFLAGMAMIWVMDRIMRALSRLQSTGTIDMRNAIGEKGTVYLRIPAGGTGKANVVVQGRLITVDAVAENKEEIPTSSQVEVVGVQNSILVVRKA
jgi:membrane protein implicated in regulation of membrane protease activity